MTTQRAKVYVRFLKCSFGPAAFLNLTNEPGEIVVVYTPGGRHKFYEELVPISRSTHPDRDVIAALFEKYDMALLGPPLSPD